MVETEVPVASGFSKVREVSPGSRELREGVSSGADEDSAEFAKAEACGFLMNLPEAFLGGRVSPSSGIGRSCLG
jgi:hypothetical protein